MDGIFVSLVMNGPGTKIFIRHFNGEKHDNGVMLSTTDFASLMFQLKAIEHSFLLGERKAEFTAAAETAESRNYRCWTTATTCFTRRHQRGTSRAIEECSDKKETVGGNIKAAAAAAAITIQ